MMAVPVPVTTRDGCPVSMPEATNSPPEKAGQTVDPNEVWCNGLPWYVSALSRV